jgi:hypothetical protein
MAISPTRFGENAESSTLADDDENSLYIKISLESNNAKSSPQRRRRTFGTEDRGFESPPQGVRNLDVGRHTFECRCFRVVNLIGDKRKSTKLSCSKKNFEISFSEKEKSVLAPRESYQEMENEM